MHEVERGRRPSSVSAALGRRAPDPVGATPEPRFGARAALGRRLRDGPALLAPDPVGVGLSFVEPEVEPEVWQAREPVAGSPLGLKPIRIARVEGWSQAEEQVQERRHQSTACAKRFIMQD